MLCKYRGCVLEGESGVGAGECVRRVQGRAQGRGEEGGGHSSGESSMRPWAGERSGPKYADKGSWRKRPEARAVVSCPALRARPLF